MNAEAEPSTTPQHFRDSILDCPRCEIDIHGQILYTAFFDDGKAPEYALQLLRCPRCAGPILASRWFERWADHDEVSIDVGRLDRVWPRHDLDDSISSDAPGPARFAHDEAKRCLKAHANTAAAALVRSCLEEIAKDLGADGKTLAAKLTDLKDRGLLDERLYEWATEVRLAGNNALHQIDPTKPVTATHANDMVSLMRAFAEYIYTFQRKFEQFKARRSDVAERSTIDRAVP